jgi:peptidoglycan/xylan/chitin deacetylase (PgdA/CDA1 family)
VRLPILTYHSIDRTGSIISTSPEKFKNQMQLLQELSFQVISLGEVAACLSRGLPLPSRSLVITFDDGFKSVYHEAFQVLRKMGFPATVFIVPEYCGRNNQWPGQLKMIPALDLLDWNEVLEMAGQGIEFGAHTQNHSDLSKLSFDRAVGEIKESKSIIQDHLGREVRYFAYPYGKWTRKIQEFVGREFSAACSTELGFVTSRSDSFCLPRIDMYYFVGNNLFARLGTPTLRQYLRFRRVLRRLRSHT